jgi:single-strand DNA-binding protein
MANLNKVMLMGNITRDPELTYLPSQTPVCEFGLAVNRSWTGQDGVKKEETTFVDCTCFGKTAEVLSKYKKKGDPLFVEGRLKLDQWEAQDGSKRSKMRVVVENFQFLNRGSGQGAGHNAGGGDEYAGEPGGGGGGGYAPRQQAPRGQGGYRQGGRPGMNNNMGGGGNAGPARPAPAPNYDAGDAIPADDNPPISNDDIPF